MKLADADKTIGLLKTRLYETALNNATVNCDASQLYTECADNRIEAWIDEMPTVDAVPVVRCKDCKYAHMTHGGECKYCDVWEAEGEIYLDGDFYCAFGERREDDSRRSN